MTSLLEPTTPSAGAHRDGSLPAGSQPAGLIHPDTASSSSADRAVKRERVLGILDAAGADAIRLTSHAAIAWYLDGARTHVSLMGDPVLAVQVDRDRDVISVFTNEAERMTREELPGDAEVIPVPWAGSLASAFPVLGQTLAEADVAAQLRAARGSLLPTELARYRELCGEAASAVSDAIFGAQPGMTERELAAHLGFALLSRGIDPVVILVAGQSRLAVRHPLPTEAALGERTMVVVCGRRHGMIANVTRWVTFTRPDGALRDATARILEVEADTFDATVPGAAMTEVFSALTSAYGERGFAADEWMNHHQGGAAGYNGRDPRVVATVPDVVQLGQPFAWNPTAPGVKVEDTVLLSAEGIVPLTTDLRWPTVTVRGRERPDELQL